MSPQIYLMLGAGMATAIVMAGAIWVLKDMLFLKHHTCLIEGCGRQEMSENNNNCRLCGLPIR